MMKKKNKKEVKSEFAFSEKEAEQLEIGGMPVNFLADNALECVNAGAGAYKDTELANDLEKYPWLKDQMQGNYVLYRKFVCNKPYRDQILNALANGEDPTPYL